MNNIKYIVVAPSPCMMNIQHPIFIYKKRRNKHKYFKTHRKQLSVYRFEIVSEKKLALMHALLVEIDE